MAINTEKVNSQLQLILDDGLNEEGNAVYRTKSFNNVKTEATSEQLYNVAQALAVLQEKPLVMVERKDDSLIIQL
ncbi:DUF1659 domain-containing protein [Halobacillus fulvus]|nr:DUF1659 domain-containing protein [Halobacillus fulvus]